MAIAFDAKATTGRNTAGGTHNWTHVCTGSDLILIVQVNMRGITGTVSGITYNGVELTFIVEATNTARRVQTWYLFNPATGSNTVSLTFSVAPATSSIIESYSFTGVDSSGFDATAVTATGNSTAPSSSIATNTADAMVVDCMMTGNLATSALGAGQTYMYDDDGGTDILGNSSYEPAASPATVTMDYTIATGQWAKITMALKPVAAAGGQPFAKRVAGIPGMGRTSPQFTGYR